MLFVKSAIFPVSPASLERAMDCASRILRSDAYKNVVCFAYGSNPPHIRKADLDGLLASDGVFCINLARGIDALGSRAVVNCEFDAWTIYVNPGMLVEMTIREREEEEIRTNPDINNHNMLDIVQPFENNIPKHRSFNSLVYETQRELNLAAQQARTASKAAPAWKRTRRHEPPNMAPTPAPMTVLDKNALMLTVLLIHEVSHLLYALFSSNKVGSATGKTFDAPSKDYPGYRLYDFGHIVEKELFGYVIQHAISHHFNAPFAVEHIVGCPNQDTPHGYVLMPQAKLLTWLRGEDIQGDAITAQELALQPHGHVVFIGERRQINVSTHSSRHTIASPHGYLIYAGDKAGAAIDGEADEDSSDSGGEDPMLASRIID